MSNCSYEEAIDIINSDKASYEIFFHYRFQNQKVFKYYVELMYEYYSEILDFSWFVSFFKSYKDFSEKINSIEKIKDSQKKNIASYNFIMSTDISNFMLENRVFYLIFNKYENSNTYFIKRLSGDFYTLDSYSNGHILKNSCYEDDMGTQFWKIIEYEEEVNELLNFIFSISGKPLIKINNSFFNKNLFLNNKLPRME